MEEPPRKTLSLGEYLVEPGPRKVTREGEPVRLSKLPFQVLLYLIEHRDRVVTRAELIERFWDGKDVYDDTLHKCIGAIRRALDDSSSTPRFVETRHREGYRFIGPVEEIAPLSGPVEVEVETTRGVELLIEEEESGEVARPERHALSSPAPARRRGVVRAASLALVLASVAVAVVLLLDRPAGPVQTAPLPPAPDAVRSIAVLPLENLSGDPNEEFLSDGLTESLINDLSRVNNLKVISRRSAFVFKGTHTDAREVGQRLGVAAVLEGSVRRSGETMRIDVRLVSTEDGRVLWASDADERLTGDLVNVQDALSCRVASELRVRLCGEGQEVSKRYIRNVDAYRAYLKGRYHWNRRTTADMRKAVEYFEEAIAIEPDYALAYAGLAETYAIMEANGNVPPGSVAAKGEASARRALELDESLASAWAARGLLRCGAYDWTEGERYLKRALELSPSYAPARQWYANAIFLYRGRFEEAEAELRRAWENDPLSYPIAANLAEMYYYWRRYDRAIEQANAAVEINSGPGNAYWTMAQSYRSLGRTKEALEVSRRCGSPNAIAWLAAYTSDRPDDARRHADKIATSAQAVENPLSIASNYAWIGDRDATMRWLERSYEARQADLPVVLIAPEFDFLRSDPGFLDLVRRMGLA
jgi:TolB-like protein/DNA-binding winged helix-turn-helix (wHTH) protein